MSGSSTTHTRREIRRAVGPAAVQTLDAHAETLRQLRVDVVLLAKELAILKQAVTRLAPAE